MAVEASTTPVVVSHMAVAEAMTVKAEAAAVAGRPQLVTRF